MEVDEDMTKRDGNVIFLAFRNDEALEDDVMCFSACKHCRNKTFTITYDRPQGFPLLRCAACGSHTSRIGFAPDDASSSEAN